MPPSKRPIAHDWFHESFDALYPIVYEHRTIEAARPESFFSIDQTALTPSDCVLDLACGSGRHMAHLAEVSTKVVGLDFSQHLLSVAQETLGADAKLVRADMRNQPFENAFDVVMNYFTSFGYFQTSEENEAVVEGISNSLRPRGRFFVDYLNRNWAEHNLESETRRKVRDYEISERRWIDFQAHRINKTTVVSRNGEEVSDSGESVQLYTEDEFRIMLARHRLIVDRVFGNYDGVPVSDQQPRLILVGHKA